MIGLVGRLIGLASAALGVFLLWASPVSTVSCSHHSGGVACRVDRAMLGLLPIDGTKIPGVLSATVDRNSPPLDPSHPAVESRVNDTYQLAFQTKSGRVDGEGLLTIAEQVNDLVGGPGEPFVERSFNGCPNVAGTIFSVVGLLMTLFAR